MKRQLGHDLGDIVFGSSFNNVPCKASDFVWSFDEIYGNCFTFNSGFDSNETKMRLKDQIMSGPEHGLTLKVYVNVYEKLLSYQALNLGALIRIGNSSYSTYYQALSGILVAPGFQTNIAVDREIKSILSKPYSNCDIDSNSPQIIQGSDLYNLIVESKYE